MATSLNTDNFEITITEFCEICDIELREISVTSEGEYNFGGGTCETCVAEIGLNTESLVSQLISR